MPERVLVLVGSKHLGKDELSFLGRCASRGARVVAWQHPIVGQDRFPSPDIAKYLQDLGIEATPLPVALSEPANTEVEEAVIAWMKRLGRTPLGPLGFQLSAPFKFLDTTGPSFGTGRGHRFENAIVDPAPVIEVNFEGADESLARFKECADVRRGGQYRRLRFRAGVCLLSIHPRAPNLIGLRSPGTMPA